MSWQCFIVLTLSGSILSKASGIIIPFGPSEPFDRRKINTTFWLYSLRNPEKPQLLQMQRNLNVTGSDYDFLLETKIIIHGAHARSSSKWVQALKDALLQFCGCNVIIVDWTIGASSNFYPQLISNGYLVGEELAIFIQNLLNATLADAGMFHLIGHSIGAHLAGTAGQTLNGEIGRITGLDPAGYLYEDKNENSHLDSSDAMFVDVVHTGAGSGYNRVGTKKKMGHVDYFLNGGERQPGCNPSGKTGPVNIFKSLSPDQIKEIACSHARAHEVYTSSIGRKLTNLMATPCPTYEAFQNGDCGLCSFENDTCAAFGILAAKPREAFSKKMPFFLTTKSEKPFFN